MNRYYYAPGMMYPYWIVYEQHDWPEVGDVTTVAMNSAASTDMGDLYDNEFFEMFSNAFEISEAQYTGQTIDADDGLAWAMFLRKAKQ